MRVFCLSSEAGAIYFDRKYAVLSALRVIPPKVEQQILQKNAVVSERLVEGRIGSGSIVLEGHLLPQNGEVGALKRLLCRIAYPGGTVCVESEGLRRSAFVSSLLFDGQAPYGSGVCEHFTLTLVSEDPFFDGDEETFLGVRDCVGELYFPFAPGEVSTGSMKNTGSVVVNNRGDAVRGFVAELYFPEDTVAFTLHSDREEGIFAFTEPILAGTRLILDTRRGRKSVMNGEGTSLLPYLDKRCVFFSAFPGKTRLSWRSIDSAPPEISVRFVPGYQSL